MIAIPGLLLVGFLPGAVIYRLPYGDRAKRAALPADERAFWAVMISVALTTFVALALAALGRYSLNHVMAVNGAVAAVALALGRGRLRYDSPAPRPGWAAIAPASLVVLGCWLYVPPSEYVIGGKDPGIYVNQGIQIAQRGTLTISDPTIRDVPERFRPLFRGAPSIEMQMGLYQGLRFMGFFVDDWSTGAVVGQFPQGFPLWSAIGYGIHGLTGVRHIPAAWAILGIAAVYFLFARLLGPATACAGAVLLAVNVAEVWFARYPNSEVMQQALLAAALLALARAYRDGDPFFDSVAAGLLGAMLFVRIDTVLVLGMIGAGFVLLATDGTRPRLRLLALLVLCAAWAAPYYTGTLRMYSSIPLAQLHGGTGLAAATGALAVALAGVLALRRMAPGTLAATRRWIPRAMAVAVVALAAYAYFLRQPGGRLAHHDAYALRTLGWYTGDATLAFAVAGLAAVILRHFWRDPVSLTTLTGLAVFYLYKVRIVPDHFWQARRYLPAILPLACVMAAVIAFWEPRRAMPSRSSDGPPPRRWPRLAARVAQAVVVLGIAGWGAMATTPAVFRHVEYAGVIPALESLAARFTDRDLVLIESRNASDAHVLATPLSYIYARPVLVLDSSRPDLALMAAFLDWARPRYDRVYFIADGGTALASDSFTARPEGLTRIAVPEYESLRNAYPTHVRTKKFSLSTFQLMAPSARTPVADIDVGGQDDVWVLRIFAKQDEGAVSYRWTRNVSYVTMVNVPPGRRRLTLWMSDGGRPAAAGGARVRVRFGDRVIGEVIVNRGGFAPYTLDLPEGVVTAATGAHGTLTLRIESTVWSPLTMLGVPDDRELGVMLDRVRIE